jgi:hypothetical protein
MNHFPISYEGNKRNEYKEFKHLFKLDAITTIIEPFCGSSAISYNLYKDHPGKFTYILNDNSPELIALYNHIKTQDIDIFIKKINEIKATITNKAEYVAMCKKKDKSLYEWFIMYRYRTLRPGLYIATMHKQAYTLNKEQINFIKFIKDPKVIITNDNWFTSFDKYKNDEKALLIFDPPYMQSCNQFYLDPTFNVYEYLSDNKIETFKSNIMLILEKTWLISLLFKTNKQYTYDKTYNATKKKTSHFCITNY